MSATDDEKFCDRLGCGTALLILAMLICSQTGIPFWRQISNFIDPPPKRRMYQYYRWGPPPNVYYSYERMETFEGAPIRPVKIEKWGK